MRDSLEVVDGQDSFEVAGGSARMPWTELLLLALSILVFVICVKFCWLRIEQLDPGFVVDPDTWRITQSQPDCVGRMPCGRTDDLVLQIGEVSHQQYLADWALELPWQAGVQIVVERQLPASGPVRIEFALQPVERTLGAKLESNLTAFMPLLFWLVATSAILFVRPRNSRRLLLVLLNFDIALWLAAGAISANHAAYSAVLFHIAIWVFLPLCVHAHLLLLSDRQLSRRGRFWLTALYVASALALGLDLDHRLSSNAFIWPLLTAMTIALFLLFRAIYRGEEHRGVTLRIMVLGVAFGLGPSLLVALSTAWDQSSGIDILDPLTSRALFMLTVPIWPLAYSYSIYRHRLGTLEFRANRLLGMYAYGILGGGIFAVTLAIGHRLSLVGNQTVFALATAIIFLVIAPGLRPLCQRLIDQHIFGLRYQPEQLVGAFAKQLPAATVDSKNLHQLIDDEILPALLVRKSALWLFREDRAELYAEQGLTVQERAAEPHGLAVRSGRYLRLQDHQDPQLAWVRLAVALRFDDDDLGLWLLGRRDPDDFYSRSDITLLEELAGLISSALHAQREMSRNQSLQEQLFRAQKLEAVGRLSAGLAHDFNNLLSVIRMNCDFLAERLGHDDRARRYAVGIAAAEERAAALTRQLLTFSSQQTLDVKTTDLNAVVTNLQPLLETTVGQDIEFVLDLADGLPAVEIDPPRFEQVIVNLVVNARDAMPEGGSISLETRIELGNKVTEDWVVLAIKDTGEGVPLEIQRQVFEPFFTTKPAGKGTGLGLSIVYGILEQSGGSVSFDSAPNEGTLVTLRLPPSNLALEEPKVPVSAVQLRDNTILLVEDEAPLRDAVTDALSDAGFRVLAAKHGQAALELFDLYGDEVELLLTDVMMPGLSGTQLASQILARRPNLRVLFMSGYNEERVLSGEIDEEKIDLLQKPFTKDELLHRIDQAMPSESS